MEALTIALAVILGLPFALAISPDLRRGALLGVSILIGLALPPLVLGMLTAVGVRWTAPVAVGSAVVVAALAWLTARGRAAAPGPGARPPRPSRMAMVFDGFTAILISGYALFALAGPPAETDFIAIWGLKGLRFWHAQGIDIAFLEKGWNVFAHPDYPPLLPLLYDWLALGGGWWRDRWFGALFVLFGLAALLVVRSVLEEDLGSDAAAALATMALVPWAVAPYIGLAEGPMIAYATAGVLLVRRGFVREIPGNVAVGAVLLGLAASTKNEGLTLVACAIIASVASSGLRSTMRLWPAVVIPLPWLIFRSVAGLTTDLATAGVTSRFAGHLREFDEILLAIARTPFGKPFFWAGIAVALLIGGRAMLRRERFLLGTVALQYFFYVGAYFVTPHDISWHVKWSWERVVNQMTLLLAFCAVSVVLLELQRRLTDSQRAEVSSDELRT